MTIPDRGPSSSGSAT